MSLGESIDKFNKTQEELIEQNSKKMRFKKQVTFPKKQL
jgi:hypothetical protein